MLLTDISLWSGHAWDLLCAAARQCECQVQVSCVITSDLAMSGQLINRTEYIFKVLVVGELGSGKTSIIKRYVHQFFSEHYRATIGVDFATKCVEVEGKTVKVQIWDTAGQERYQPMAGAFYRGALGALLVYDITRSSH